MIIIFGSYNCGKCDEVPRLCHVETHFAHVYYVPLIPLGSVAVFGRNPDSSQRRIPIGLSIKSVLIGWLRAACVAGAVACALGAIAIGFNGKQPVIVPIFFGFLAVCGVLAFIA